MNNKAHDLKKKIAFAAAILMVSHSFAAMPLSDNAQMLTAHAAEQQEPKTTAPSVKADNDTGSTDTASVTTAADSTPAANTTAAATTTTAPPVVKVKYVVSVKNMSLGADKLKNFVRSSFGVGDDAIIPAESDDKKITLKIEEKDTLPDDITFDDKKFKLVSTKDNVLEYEGYFHLNKYYDKDEVVAISGTGRYPDNSDYFKPDSIITLTTTKNYLFKDGPENNETFSDKKEILVTDKAALWYGAYPSMFSKVGDGPVASYEIVHKSFTLGDLGECKVRDKFNNEKKKDDVLKWDEVSEYYIETSGKQAITVSNGSVAKRFTVNNNKVYFSEILDDTDLSYKHNTVLSFSAVDKAVKVHVRYNNNTKDDAEFVADVYQKEGKNYFNIPYRFNSDYYLDLYNYQWKDNEINNSLSQLEKGVYDLPVEYSPGNKDIILYYKKMNNEAEYKFMPSSPFNKRNDNCYTIDTNDKRVKVADFPENYYGYNLLWDVCSTDNKLKKNHTTLSESTNSLILDSSNKYILAQNLLYEDKDYLENSCCFYKDTQIPDVTIQSADENWKNNTEGSKYIFTVTDFEDPSIDRNGPLSYEQKEILRVYDEYINVESPTKQEIATIFVGDYRFDRGPNGWASGVTCTYETEEMRDLKKDFAKSLRDEYEELCPDTSDRYLISEIESGYKGITAQTERKLSEINGNLNNENLPDDDRAKYEDDLSNLTVKNSDLTTAKQSYDDKYSNLKNGEANVDYVPSIKLEGNKFVVTVKVKKAGTVVSNNDIKISAMDNSGNRSGEETVKLHIDDSTPEVDTDSIKITSDQNTVLKGDEVVLKKDYKISATVTDQGSGIDKVYCYIDGSTKTSDNDNRKRMSAAGNTYSYTINDNDVPKNSHDHSKDGKKKLTFFATDNAGNTINRDNSTVISERTVIIDTTAPECSISDESPEGKGVELTVDGKSRKWYADYSDIILPVKAFDQNPEICSGIKCIRLYLNADKDHTSHNDGFKELQVQPGDGTESGVVYAEPLDSGKYYVAFEAYSGDNEKFSAYLKRTDNADVKILLFEGCSRGETENNSSKGSIRVMIGAEDRADIASRSDENNIETEVFVDLNDPEVATVDAYDNRRIYEKGTDTDGNKANRFDSFSNRQYNAVIRIDDFGASSGIAGIKVDLFNADGSLYREDYPVQRENNNNVWFMTVPMDFKGEMRIVATDNVRRNSVIVKTLGFITESGEKHDATSSLSIELPETSYRDRNGLPLYSDSKVTAKITVKDSFSEIKDVTTNATGSPEKRINVEADGNISGDDSGAWRVSKGETDRNLVPELTRDIEVSENTNGNKISVSMTDNAGNTGELKVEEREFSIDATDPRVDVKFVDTNGSADSEYSNVFKRPRKAVITVTERNFDEARVNVTLNGAKQDLSWSHSGGTEGTDDAQYSAELPIEADGVYKLAASCTDMGNRSSNTYESEQFTIDRTAPALKIDFDKKVENGHFYKDTVVASFAVSDNNFDPKRIQVTGTYNNKTEGFPALSTWIKNGDSYVATIKFDKDGEYAVNISGTDKAGNAVTPYNGTFNVDKNSPAIKISDVKPANNDDEIKPRLIFTDPNLDKDTIKITLEGANRGKDLDFKGKLEETDNGYEYVFDNIPDKEDYDDIYTIRATAKDKAENRTDETFRFSVNRFGSTFMFDDATQAIAGKYVSKAHDIVITEFNADKHSGDYSVFITKDGEMRELVDNEEYRVKVSGGDTSWTEYEYTIPSEIFEEDGRYTVSIHSTDEAGNINISASSKKKAELDFCIDNTRPLCIPLNISENGAYKGEMHTARLSVSDNIMLKNAEVFIDGSMVESDFSNDECVFEIPNSKHSQDVKVVLTDMADNRIEYIYKNILVTTNVARLLAHRTWFKIACGATAVAAGAAAFVIRRRRRSRY